MKSLFLSLGTLLLIAFYCDAVPQAVLFSTAPVTCCNKFSTFKIPESRVSDIKKTHSSCLRQGFIVKTVAGRRICFKQSDDWAQKPFYRKRISEGSGRQP
ncbi:C-C motif chemokine 4-like [Cyprinodon tularosa]|uniref:C-C motif chemokine 4-like n=1 Tax=Cyprinodon tularosa TaxID=77115 RepID=UPI0018E22CD2|nr:C-C motif chemokine 4-like [Cyprinodon tularosa]